MTQYHARLAPESSWAVPHRTNKGELVLPMAQHFMLFQEISNMSPYFTLDIIVSSGSSEAHHECKGK